ncbi:hypothetical protein TraAM80_02512 [Trypanosoma rangeli]|uniref:Uncharacterized protein n=1 Tax=Trypanosoma rangeli TaxID=5698 RepID=A0A3R7MWG9_TRYRA|nr:uncharacterized protein TraAM80_02512 [Trypanosoma rangeli]RNF09080.1 hypothetical protein TraAM80_02512 [Trypanosoma rangeli]|eukprot:RNF09080.1 hypothetical protein TraAM80_02512 [Trypanosoma rangeli]
MSDALAILDGAAACVSALLMPEELGALINFLRGESWEEVSPTPPPSSSTTTPTAVDGDVSWRLPNVLIGCYNLIPLAIAADVSLVSVSSSGERAALVHNFERHEFRVFAVNLMPEGCPAEDSVRHRGGSGSAVVRLNCMEAAQAWCDSVYAEKDGCPARSPILAGSKRSRGEASAASPPPPSIARRQHTSGPCTRRALFVLRCCANEGAACRDDVGRARPFSDPLMLLLHDISALAALCRAREATYRSRIQFSVLLLPDDLAYGGALLEEALREPLSCEYCVKLFRGSAASATRRDDAERRAFICRLETWMNVPTASPPPGDAEGGKEGVTRREHQQQQQLCSGAEVEVAEKTRQRESSFFFVRRENLPLCCFLREALRRFPVILHPVALRHLQALWATRRQLGDVVTGLHALLCPFAHFASTRDRRLSATLASPPVGPSMTDTTASGGNGSDGICRHADTVDILNALFVAAGQLADGELLNEAVTFAVLYEDIVRKRSMRLQRIPGFVSVLERLWQRWGNEKEMAFHEALASCVPVYTPSSALQNEFYHSPREEGAEEARAVVSIPAAMQVPAAKTPLGAELMHSALLAVLPPQESLEELRRAVGQCSSHGGPRGEAGECRHDCNGAAAVQGWALSENNFFNPSIPDSVRLLHLLTAHALGQRSSRQRYVSFALLQRVCQIPDEALVRALKELKLAGLVKVNGRDAKVKATLDG